MEKLLEELAINNVKLEPNKLETKVIPSYILADAKISGGCADHQMSGQSGNTNYWQNICR
jgi:hypothetical protein